MTFLERAMTRLVVVGAIGGACCGIAQADQVSPPCKNSFEITRLASPLSRVARRLVAGEPITIVAIGSSSTAGAGASSPANSYPSQLEVELKEQFRGHAITVLNRGVNGEEVGDMIKRFDEGVIAAKPDLVLWQFGTNSVLRDHNITEHDAIVRVGLKKLRAIGADVVLIDPQYAPRMLEKPEGTASMLRLMKRVSKRDKVNLFRRYDEMKHWHEVDQVAMDTFIAPDGLHLNDWSYACMAKGLGEAIAEAAMRPVMSASTRVAPYWYP